MSRFEDIDYTSLKDTFYGMLNGGNEILRCMATNAQRLLEHLVTYRSLEDLTTCATQRPLLAVFVIAVTLSCGIPVLLFLLFVCLTVLLTFTGFLVIEGTIITIGSIFLCGFILAMMAVMLSLFAVIGLTYFGFIEMLSLVQIQTDESPSRNLIPKPTGQKELMGSNNYTHQMENNHNE